jgi:raffinose/stachyose/melibiose transport system permease protein
MAAPRPTTDVVGALGTDRRLLRLEPAARSTPRLRPRERVSRGMGPGIALSLLPALVLFGTFFVIPFVVLVYTAFHKWDVVELSYVGLGNFRFLFEDPVFWQALRNTGIYAALGVFVHVPLACVVAIILSQKPKGWRLFRVVFFLPNVVSFVAFATVFLVVYNARYGLLNQVLDYVGVESLQRDWLFDVKTALPAVAATYVFAIGAIMLLVMAEIASIPRELYEAAEVDGASRLQRHLYVTVPLLRNVIGTIVLLSLIGTLALFDAAYVLTSGGPNNATLTVSLYAFQNYVIGDWGYANAVGCFIVVSGLFVILTVRRIFRIGERDV